MALEITLADGAAGERAGLYYALGELYLRGLEQEEHPLDTWKPMPSLPRPFLAIPFRRDTTGLSAIIMSLT